MSDKDIELVPVMMPRAFVKKIASGDWCENEGEEVEKCCRKALRPEPPSLSTLVNLKNRQMGDTETRRFFDWAEYVLANGWDVSDKE